MKSGGNFCDVGNEEPKERHGNCRAIDDQKPLPIDPGDTRTSTVIVDFGHSDSIRLSLHRAVTMSAEGKVRSRENTMRLQS